jgi:hypothetical protein
MNCCAWLAKPADISTPSLSKGSILKSIEISPIFAGRVIAAVCENICAD